jgi:hypothetical protein
MPGAGGADAVAATALGWPSEVTARPYPTGRGVRVGQELGDMLPAAVGVAISAIDGIASPKAGFPAS